MKSFEGKREHAGPLASTTKKKLEELSRRRGVAAALKTRNSFLSRFGVQVFPDGSIMQAPANRLIFPQWIHLIGGRSWGSIRAISARVDHDGRPCAGRAIGASGLSLAPRGSQRASAHPPRRRECETPKVPGITPGTFLMFGGTSPLLSSPPPRHLARSWSRSASLTTVRAPEGADGVRELRYRGKWRFWLESLTFAIRGTACPCGREVSSGTSRACRSAACCRC